VCVCVCDSETLSSDFTLLIGEIFNITMKIDAFCTIPKFGVQQKKYHHLCVTCNSVCV
jgi:hypothetical protein